MWEGLRKPLLLGANGPAGMDSRQLICQVTSEGGAPGSAATGPRAAGVVLSLPFPAIISYAELPVKTHDRANESRPRR